MSRYFLQLAYNGTNYNGWQIQPNGLGVQQVLQECMSLLLKENIKIVGAGRTDTGVHAFNYFAHFDTKNLGDKDKFIYRLNKFLPPDIAIKNVYRMTPEAHARFDATQRTYRYWLSTRKDVFLIKRAATFDFWKYTDRVDEAAVLIQQIRDFTSYSKPDNENKSRICNVTEAFWEHHDGLHIFQITANRFLHNMVRCLVGTMLEIASGRKMPQDLLTIAEAKDRRQAGFNAHPEGLYFWDVKYPDEIFIDKIE